MNFNRILEDFDFENFDDVNSYFEKNFNLQTKFERLIENKE